MTARPGLAPEDIGSLRQVDDPRVSPDGGQVAFTVTDADLESNRYRHRIWLAAVDGVQAARPFTAGPDDTLPRWSPDGSRLAFAVNPHDGQPQICVIPVAGGGERVVICSWPEAITELSWSPDGTRLAFVARDPDPAVYGPPGEQREAKDMPPRRITRFFSRLNGAGWVVDRPTRVMVVAADGSSPPRRLTTGPYQASHAAWSPDGTRLAFASGRHETWDLDQAVDLWTVAADGSGEPERLTETESAYSAPSWSPDGTRLAYLREPVPTDGPWHNQVGVLDLGTGTRSDLTTALDRNCGPYGSGRAPVWIGDAVVCSTEDHGNLHLYAVPADGSAGPELLVGGERWVAAWDWAGGTLALAVTDQTSLPELVTVGARASVGSAGQGAPTAVSLDRETERRLTDLTGPLRERVELVAAERFVARSADGTEVECWAMAPVGDGTGRHPTLLNVHGGPFTQYGNRFFDEFQLEVGAGFGVVYCNPRGSSGYSEAWGRSVRWPECKVDPGSGWGGVDFEDVMACVDEACRRFSWVDPERLGVMGGSYGGYMASWVIGHTDRFRAACSERAANNLLTIEHNSDIGTSFRAYVGATIVENPAAYARQSPITYVDAMTTPVLIVHSEDDLRCPIDQAEELFVDLRLLGRDPVLVRFPGESHELSRSGAPRHRVQRADVILDWFREQLGA